MLQKYSYIIEKSEILVLDLHKRGVELFKQNNFSAAKQLFLLSSASFISADDKLSTSISLSCLASCHQKLNDIKEGIVSLEKALDLSSKAVGNEDARTIKIQKKLEDFTSICSQLPRAGMI